MRALRHHRTCGYFGSCLPALASLLAVLACNGGGHSEVTPYRLTPRDVQTAGGHVGDDGPWALFDRDTATGWRPVLDAHGRADVVVQVDDGARIAALAVFGPSPYRLAVLDANAQAVAGPYDLTTLGAGWNRLAWDRTYTRSDLILRFEAIGETEATVPEIELWGRTDAPLPLRWEPATTYDQAPHPAVAEMVPAKPARKAIGPDTTACTSFAIDLLRHPGVYRRAWLRYRTRGVFRPFALMRALNGNAMLPGHWVASRDARVFVQRIDPEILEQGTNEFHVCLPDTARGTVEISAVELVGELEHGSNVVDTLAVAPYDGVPSTGASALLAGGEDALRIAPDQELVLGFDRLIAPYALSVAAQSEVAWTVRCVDLDGGMHPLATEPTQDVDAAMTRKIVGGAQERCAGLRLRPSAAVAITEARVIGSGAGRRVEHPRIVLASAREHFGPRAWVEGWARAPSGVDGDVRVLINDDEQNITSGAFAAMLQRPANEHGDWPVAITAILANGDTVTRTFVLDQHVDGVPGLSDDGTMDDGMTDEERAEHYGALGQTAEVEVTALGSAHIALGSDAFVDIPAGAVHRNTTVSLTHLDTAALPPLDPGLINVTAPAARGYEFRPHGQTFHKPIEVTLPYQPSLVPPGYVADDVKTFYYDDDLKRWQPLMRARVEHGKRNVVHSLTDHFTIMINAIVVAPEHPQATSFDPTRMRGIQTATPAQGIELIAPPQVNTQGDAVVSYPLDIPPGRLGVAPPLALTYSSSSQNGWLGVGWDLGLAAIGIDTRWGVPRYAPALETESYTLGGDPLAPTAHRGPPAPRAQGTTIINGKTAKLFRPRVEGAFQRIARYGSDPTSYWWEVTDRDGTRRFYGGTPETGRETAATLADDSGNVFRWALREIRDLHGNRVRFDYDAATHAPPGGMPGRELYLASVHYTLRPGETTAPYRIAFVRESGRPDVIVSGRGGFKQVTAERLARIEIFYRTTLVRAWELAYDQGPFQKSRLRRITQLGVDGAAFPGNVHRFDYFDDITAPGGGVRGFAPWQSWHAGQNIFDPGVSIPGPLVAAVGEALPSALGGSHERTAGVHFYGGFNPLSPRKQDSYGLKIGSRKSIRNGLVALVDIDGDGLPDRVVRGPDQRFYYHRNQSGPGGAPRFADAAVPIAGPFAISHEQTAMASVGPEAYPGTLSLHLNKSLSFVTEDAYLGDVNSDGLVDLVQGPSVHFNRLVGGIPTFAPDSDATPVPLDASAVDRDVLPASFEDPAFDLDAQLPPVDTIRRWQAPYTGRVRITGAVGLAAAQPAHGDGVRVSIEHEGRRLWGHDFAPTETQPQTPVIERDVAAGDRLYFRVHALHDAQGDRVAWRPVIEYQSIPASEDENGLPVHRFDAAADFVLAGRPGTGFYAPFAGTLRLIATLEKLRETSDDVTVRIAVDGVVAFEQTLAATASLAVPLDQDIDVAAGSLVTLTIDSDSPIDLAALAFEPVDPGDGTPRHGPWLRYAAAHDDTGTALPVEDDHGRPLVQQPLAYDMTSYSVRAPAAPAPAYVPSRTGTLHVAADIGALLVPIAGTVTFTAKSGGRLLAKRTVAVSGAGMQTITIDVPVTANESVFFSFTVHEPDLFPLIYTAARTESAGTSQSLPTVRYGVARAGRLARPYRGWSYFGANGGQGRGDAALDPALVEAEPSMDDTDVPADAGAALDHAEAFAEAEMMAFAFTPMLDRMPCDAADTALSVCTPAQGAHWRGPDPFAYVSATEMSASRIGGPGMRAPAPDELAGARAVPRISRSTGDAVGGGASGVSGSYATGAGTSQLDFMDLNGDGFPDVVAPGRVQYTSPRGVLAETRAVDTGGDMRRSTTTGMTVGLGGTVAEARFGSRAESGTSANKPAAGTAGTAQMATLGLFLSLGAGGGVSRSVGDLMDMNGDGLPDRVEQIGDRLYVALNLGYRFAPLEPWGTAIMHKGSSAEINGGPSLSLNDGIYGFGGGITAGLSRSQIDDLVLPAALGGGPGATLLDLNGDGLLDRVAPGTDGFVVWFHLGHGFAADPVIWRGRIPGADISEQRSTSLATGAYVTVPIPLCPGACYLILNPGGDTSESIERPVAVVRDIDGDGFADHLVADGMSRLRVAKNRTGRTNLLRTIERPLGARISLDYRRAGNTQTMPQSRWVLSRVTVFDGVADSAELGEKSDYTVERFGYAEGRYDRAEREFYGFAHITVDTLDTRGWDGTASVDALPVYRTTEMDMHTGSYARRGLVEESRFLAGDGALYRRSVYRYQLRDPATGAALTDAQAQGQASVFPALVREDHYQHEGDPAAFVHTYTAQDYDTDGNVIETIDAGGPGPDDDLYAEIRYTGRLAACRDRHIVGTADRIVIRNGSGAVMRRRDADIQCADGTIREIRVHQGSGEIAHTTLFYDEFGNLSGVTGPRNHKGQRMHHAYSYDSDVHTYVVRIDDSHGYVSTAAYDMRFGVVTRDTDINGVSVTTDYDAFGRPRRITGPYERDAGLPYTIEFAYAITAAVPYARTAHMDRFRDVADPIETVTFIDGLGRALQTKKDATVHRGDDAPAADVMIASGRALFDPWGRVAATWHPTEEPKSPAFNHALSHARDSRAPPTRIAYDVLDRAVATVLPDSAQITHTHTLAPALAENGLWSTTTTLDPETHRRDQVRDGRGRIRAVTDYIDGRSITTRYHYDALDQLRRIVDAAGNTTTTAYDLAGRRTDVVHPDSGHEHFVYDRAGHLIRRVTPNLRRAGQAIEYRYHYDQLTNIAYPEHPENNVSYTWGDAAMRGQGGHRVGRIVRIDDGSGWQSRSYGALGEIVREARGIAGPGPGEATYITRYQYDTWGRLQQLVYPDGEILTYRYDAGGRVRAAEGVKLGVFYPYLTRLEYDRFAQRAFAQYGNGVRTHYTYDPHRRWLDSLDAGTFQRTRYTFDKVGNVTTARNDVMGVPANQLGGRVEQSFTYDDLGRLTRAEGTWHDPPGFRDRYSFTLGYDDIHNITRKTQTHSRRTRKNSHDIAQQKTTYDWAYAYDAEKPHAATHIGDRRFFYDQNGNQTGWTHDASGRRRIVTWDEENRVRAVADNGRTTRFVYDHRGQRAVKSGAQGETAYVSPLWTVRNRTIATKHIVIGADRIASKLSPGTAHLQPDADDPLAQMLGTWWEHRAQSGHDHANNTNAHPRDQVPSRMPDSGQPDNNFVYFYHRDHLGSTGFVTAADATLYAHVQYFPSGEPWVDQRANTERLPYLLTDKELDQETGLYYFGARYYDPRTSLWQSTDPAQTEYLDEVSRASGLRSVLLSTYAYAAHNPVLFIDPDGRRPWYSSALDWVQDGLDVASMGMDGTGAGAVFSWVPDLLNAGISGLRGDTEGAVMSLGAALPGVGNVGNAARLTRSAAKRAKKARKAAKGIPQATTPYKRPSGATTRQQRASVQGKPCVDCGEITTKQVADHKKPLVKEYYETGTIDKARMRSPDAVQPQCPTCSNRQGADMSRYSREMKKKLDK